MNISELPGLRLSGVIFETTAENYRPNMWPPSDDFPVVIDSTGKVISRYGDIRWDLSIWNGSTLSIYFGDGLGNGRRVSPKNACILRQIVAWWLWGTSTVVTARTIASRFKTLKPIFDICTINDISVTELSYYPKVIKEIASHFNSGTGHLLTYLNEINFASDKLGFIILDKQGIKVLIEHLVPIENVQTPYIPVRIWSYQVGRLKECLDDFMRHQEKIVACFNFCLDGYSQNAGGNLSDAFGGLGFNSPFNAHRVIGQRKSGKVFYGSFSDTAKSFGIDELLEKWTNSDRINNFSSYMTLISSVGLAYILNFSLMRVEECSRLRTNCLEVERDLTGADVYLIKGITTKTIEDSDAKWIVSPAVEIAINAMRIIASLRLKAAKENPKIHFSKEDIDNPVLQSLAREPWASIKPSHGKNEFKRMRSYAEFRIFWPKLFADEELKITEKDLEIANRITYGLDSEKFAVGKIWTLAWHQLRRTGAVNMLASGLVSEFSVQYQLKHSSQAMSRYYGQNYYKLTEPLDNEARNYYVRQMYESIARDFKELQSQHYISPHSQKRKDQIISEISEKDHTQLIEAAKEGRISYRETFLGGCANIGPPCSLGGISNISSCMGFGDNKPCNYALINAEKLPVIHQLKNVLINQKIAAVIGTPQYESLQAQIESAERAIHVINVS
ncbi:hypothetical protein ACTXMT_13025 [Psychrobacter faecalis]|uniref:hypothetical protein n=1 Tax=Psychrobacter faecalis TaxID=180588 RepID=UPI003FCFEA0D